MSVMPTNIIAGTLCSIKMPNIKMPCVRTRKIHTVLHMHTLQNEGHKLDTQHNDSTCKAQAMRDAASIGRPCSASVIGEGNHFRSINTRIKSVSPVDPLGCGFPEVKASLINLKKRGTSGTWTCTESLWTTRRTKSTPVRPETLGSCKQTMQVQMVSNVV